MAERDAARARARAELENVDQTVNLDEQRELMEEMGGGFSMPAFPGLDAPPPPPPPPPSAAPVEAAAAAEAEQAEDAEMEEGEV